MERGGGREKGEEEADPEGFKKVSGGDLGIPLLFVGNTKLRGYLESDWDSALDIAGYPKTALGPVKPAAKPAAAAKKSEPLPPTPAANGNPAPAQ